MAYVNDSTEQSKKSFMLLPSAKNCTITWNFYRKTSMHGCTITTMSDLTAEGIVMAKLQRKRLLNLYL